MQWLNVENVEVAKFTCAYCGSLVSGELGSNGEWGSNLYGLLPKQSLRAQHVLCIRVANTISMEFAMMGHQSDFQLKLFYHGFNH
jgi:hypothetical protein